MKQGEKTSVKRIFAILKVLEILVVIGLIEVIYLVGIMNQQHNKCSDFLSTSTNIRINIWICGFVWSGLYVIIGFMIIIFVYFVLRLIIKKNWEWAKKIEKY